MIDLHCHVLPGIDDGPATMEDSLALAAAAAADGTHTIVATPHVSWEWPENDAGRIAAGVSALNTALREAHIEIEVLAGAEVALSRAADLDLAQVRALRLGGSPWLLVECPLTASAPGFEKGLAVLRGQGLLVALAHPERCPAFHADPERLAALVADGMITSLTASAFTGRFGRAVKRCAFDLLRRGLVHTVASDAHDAVRRPPALAGALAEAGLADEGQWLSGDAPRMILRGAELPQPRAFTPRARLMSRLFGA